MAQRFRGSSCACRLRRFVDPRRTARSTAFRDGRARFHSACGARGPAPAYLLFDNSTSVPAELRNSGAVEIGNAIVDELYAAHPGAELQVGTISFGYEPVSSEWASSLEEAAAQVALLDGAAANSEIWTAVAEAQRREPTVLIVVTDGDATDEATPRNIAGIALGAPVLR